jgi:hypothetical protein
MVLFPQRSTGLGFAVLFCGVLAVVGIAVPVSFGPRWENGAQPIPRGTSLCFALSYSRQSSWSDVPLTVHLLDRPSAIAPQNWSRAIFDQTHIVPESGTWRYISRDSVEIRWHHSPSIRLLVAGDTVRGEVVPAGVATPFEILFEETRRVNGAKRECSRVMAPAV